MRLIDADAFKEYMWKALEETRGCYPDNGEWAEAVTEQFCKDIDDQPTIEERKKGKWEITNLGAAGVFDSCSECKRVVKHKAPFYNFCPNCGADMREGQE